MITYAEATLGCPQQSSYTITKNNAVGIQSTLKGRPRSELLDAYAVYLVSLSFDYSMSQYNGWLTFWAALGEGVDWFEMNLTLDTTTGTLMTAHASEVFNARQTSSDRWIVSLSLEAIAP